IWFFFSSIRRHTRSKRDWSSDVCSSDLDAYQGCRCRSRRRSSGPPPAESTRTTRSWRLHIRDCRVARTVNPPSTPRPGRRHRASYSATDCWHKYGAVFRANRHGTNRIEGIELHRLFRHYRRGKSWDDDSFIAVDRPCWAPPITIGFPDRYGYLGGSARAGVFG